MMRVLLIAFMCLVGVSGVFGAEEKSIKSDHEHHLSHEEYAENHKFRAAIFMGNSYVPEGTPGEGRVGTLIVPSWGIDFEYWISKRWAISMHNEIELINYEVFQGHDEFIQRENPFSTVITATYVVWKDLHLYAGPGIEIEKNENFFIYKVGFEYEIELPNHWDLSPGAFYMNKNKGYDVIGLGLAIGKRF